MEIRDAYNKNGELTGYELMAGYNKNDKTAFIQWI